MQWAKQKQQGFTIVELLIVVVVIAILAAITIVSYNGITNRANDSTVQSDLATMGKKIMLFYADNDRYPNSIAELTTLGLNVSNGAYMVQPTIAINLGYCTDGSAKSFAMFAMSKSGNRYMIKDGARATADTTGTSWDLSTSTLGSQCGAVSLGAPFSHGYVSSDASGPWRAWAGGN